MVRSQMNDERVDVLLPGRSGSHRVPLERVVVEVEEHRGDGGRRPGLRTLEPAARSVSIIPAITPAKSARPASHICRTSGARPARLQQGAVGVRAGVDRVEEHRDRGPDPILRITLRLDQQLVGVARCVVQVLHEGHDRERLVLEVEVERRAGHAGPPRDLGDVDVVERLLAQQLVEGLQQGVAPGVPAVGGAPVDQPVPGAVGGAHRATTCAARPRSRPAGISRARMSCS